MLLNRSFCPVNDVPPPGVFTIWGAVLTKSLNARLSVGSRRNAESEISDCAPVRADDRSGFEDRKSTRLNSSHGYISYAVFCLKKKKRRTVLLSPLEIASCARY